MEAMVYTHVESSIHVGTNKEVLSCWVAQQQGSADIVT